MADITPSQLADLKDDTHGFQPMRGASNPHLQTMLPRLIRRRVAFEPWWQRLELPDGDFVDLAWSEEPNQARHKPRLVVFHGLEGSLHSPYAHGLVNAAKQRGWLGVVMHFRGCSGIPNRLNPGCVRSLARRQPQRWDIRWAEICSAACWRKRMTISPSTRR